MANGPALQPGTTPEDEELLGKVDAAQAQDRQKENLASLGGMDRMVVNTPEVDPDLDSKIAAYKKRTKDVDLDGKKDPIYKRAALWTKDKWNKGKDDPTTERREDKEDEVTKFGGGMTRQELGMFIFQWGGLMMQNADKGFGGAMGAAGTGAMAAHQARGMQAEESALAEREISAREKTAAASSRTAAMSGLSEGFTDNETGYWTVPVYNAETGEIDWETATDAEGNPKKGPPDIGNRPFAAQQLQKQLEATGFYTDQEIAMLIAKQPGKGEIRQDAMDAWERRITAKSYPEGMFGIDWQDKTDKEKEAYRSKFVESYVGEYMKAFDQKGSGGDGALPDNSGTGDPRQDAVDRNKQ